MHMYKVMSYITDIALGMFTCYTCFVFTMQL